MVDFLDPERLNQYWQNTEGGYKEALSTPKTVELVQTLKTQIENELGEKGKVFKHYFDQMDTIIEKYFQEDEEGNIQQTDPIEEEDKITLGQIFDTIEELVEAFHLI